MRTPAFAAGLALVALGAIVVNATGTPRDQRHEALAAIPAGEAAVPVSPQLFYDSNPEHLWNRIDRHFRIRVALDGTMHGADAVDALLARDALPARRPIARRSPEAARRVPRHER